ncbi:MAG: hypothetical protein LQ343_007373 [Gyalolechia ehrenbergii]|nr:MAG: hypothetical protein LQ343_007373 [Gyalolechia ehrenbergii]
MPGDALSRGLATKTAVDGLRERRLGALRDQWNLFLVEGREMATQFVPDEEAVLLSQSRKLYAAWAKFCNQLPEDQRQDNSDNIPSLNHLFQSVDKASKTWQEKREGKASGRLKHIFARLCNDFKDHSKLVSIVPREDKYVCLLTGSLSAIAQTVHRYIHELYVVVFEFLTEKFTSWSRSSWKRFEKLQHDSGSLDDAVELLRDLRSLVPPYLHCIVSGFEGLEDRDDKEQTRNLSYVLNTLTSMWGDHSPRSVIENLDGTSNQKKVHTLSQITKLCLASNGYVDALAELVEQDRLDKVEYLDEASEHLGEEGIRLGPEHDSETI